MLHASKRQVPLACAIDCFAGTQGILDGGYIAGVFGGSAFRTKRSAWRPGAIRPRWVVWPNWPAGPVVREAGVWAVRGFEQRLWGLRRRFSCPE